MAINIDELMESASSGVLRALHARTASESAKASTADIRALVQSGFNVEFHIRAGGIRIPEINPQPLPPAAGA